MCVLKGEWVWGVVVFFLGSGAFGQTGSLALSSAEAANGGTAIVNLTMSANAGSEPAAIQWAVEYPAAAVMSIHARTGSAALAAGKGVSCANRSGAYHCVLSGLNATAVASGVVASMKVTLAPGVSSVPLSVSEALGASSVATAVPMTSTGGTITVPPVFISCKPTSLTSLGSATCTVSLNQNAPLGGTAISLTSDNGMVTVPSSVVVPAGLSEAVFTASAGSVTSTTTAVVTASDGVNSGHVTLKVSPKVTIRYHPVARQLAGTQ